MPPRKCLEELLDLLFGADDLKRFLQQGLKGPSAESVATRVDQPDFESPVGERWDDVIPAALANALAEDPQVEEGRGDLLECYVRSDSRAQDLLYHYDALSRFGDAQHGGEAGAQRAEEVRNYLELRPLGRSLMSASLRVVPIDETDKAPRDLPNAVSSRMATRAKPLILIGRSASVERLLRSREHWPEPELRAALASLLSGNREEWDAVATEYDTAFRTGSPPPAERLPPPRPSPRGSRRSRPPALRRCGSVITCPSIPHCRGRGYWTARSYSAVSYVRSVAARWPLCPP